MPAPPRPPACPVCGKPAVPDHAPFCSRGCRDRDLLAWLSDAYRLPDAALDPDGLDSTDDAD
jgi:hypothetical protein